MGLNLGVTFTGTDRLSPVMGKVEQGMGRLDGARKRLAGGGGLQGVLDGMASGFQAVAARAGLAGSILVGAAGVGFHMATEQAKAFQFQVARVGTVIDESQLSTAKIRDVTMGLAKTYGGVAADQANALYETISSGITDAKKATDLLGVANRFAIGGTSDLMSSIQVLTAQVNTYEDQGLTAARASDVMFTAIAAGNTTAQQLAQYLGEVSPTAHAAGISFEELNAVIATLTVQGIKTPQAITGLNAAIANIMKPSHDATAEAKRLGIEFSATALKSKGFAGILKQLAGNAKVDAETFVKLFGSIDGGKVANALAAQSGAKLSATLDQMKGAAGATDKAFNRMNETGVQAEKRWEAMKTNALILIGEALMPIKKTMMEVATSIMEAWNAIPQGTRDVIVQVVAGGAAFTALAVAGGGLLATVVSIASFLGAGFLPIILAVGAAVSVAALTFATFATAFDENIGGVGTKAQSTFAFIKTAFLTVKELLTTGMLSGALHQEFVKGDNAAVNFGVKLFAIGQRIVHFFKSIGDGFKAGIRAAAPTFEAFTGALTKLGQAFGLLQTDSKKSAAAFDGAGSAGQKVGKILAKAGEFIVQGITKGIEIVTVMKKVWDDIEPSVMKVWSALSKIVDAVGAIIGAFSGGEAATMTFGQKLEAFGKVAGAALKSALDTTASVLEGIAGMMKAAAPFIGTFVDVIGEIFAGDWSALWRRAADIVFAVADAIVEAVMGMAEKVAAGLDFVAGLQGLDTGFAKKVGEFTKTAKEGMRASLNQQLGNVTEVTTAAKKNTEEKIVMAAETFETGARGAKEAANFQIAASEAAASAASNAVKALPPTQVNATLTVDGAVLAKMVAKANGAEGSRSNAAAPVDVR